MSSQSQQQQNIRPKFADLADGVENADLTDDATFRYQVCRLLLGIFSALDSTAYAQREQLNLRKGQPAPAARAPQGQQRRGGGQ